MPPMAVCSVMIVHGQRWTNSKRALSGYVAAGNKVHDDDSPTLWVYKRAEPLTKFLKEYPSARRTLSRYPRFSV